MKRIIEISEEDFEYISTYGFGFSEQRKRIFDAIYNSTPLTECEAEDCVSRKRALNAIGCEIVGVTQEGRELLDSCQYVIKHLPSAYPKSDKPSGKWIPLDGGWDGYKCSNCDKKLNHIWHYCPICGAKMEN